MAQQSAAPRQAQGIDTYIHESWDKLSRSTTECDSVADPKVDVAPVLYLPANEAIPAAVKAMQQSCKVEVKHLPRPIRHEGEVNPSELTAQGLLYLPNKYVVPGGRFNEMYGWDSYFILLGELSDGRLELARGTVENFFYELDYYGAILNANRTYYLTRSQPPLLSSMVLAVYRAELAQDPKAARKWLKKALPYLQRDHDFWTAEPHQAGRTGLSRYADLGNGPVPEMEDDNSYYLDVLHWLVRHRDQAPVEYLERANGSLHCVGNTPCIKTDAEGLALTKRFFAGDRAMRESGFDTSFRFGPFSGSTDDYAPICLNSLLYKYERDIAFIELTLGDATDAVEWSSIAGVRMAHINDAMWDEEQGLYFDLDFVHSRRSGYKTLASYYALWAGVATKEQAKRMEENLKLFERPGGLQTSTVETGVQWDAPFGWAPLQWLTVEGLERYGYHTDALRIAREFTGSVENGYAQDGTIREKYNVVAASSKVEVQTGYKDNIVGFGWTNAVYVKLRDLLATH
ncbi:MAG: trehalase family glycosidase [Acidobacteriaceae bacterium]|nr:trehalase family glycosidase [Acidobacteriaceae bacterium]